MLDEFKEYLDGPNYIVCLSKKIRESHSRAEICRLIVRTFEGDLGDSDDIDQIMKNVSAFMSERPSMRLFKVNGPDAPGVIAMYRPEDLKIMLIYEDETTIEKIVEFAAMIGFDPSKMDVIE
jgi:hypothetical protein